MGKMGKMEDAVAVSEALAALEALVAYWVRL